MKNYLVFMEGDVGETLYLASVYKAKPMWTANVERAKRMTRQEALRWSETLGAQALRIRR